MKYPNLRYGNPAEFRHYVQNMPVKVVARNLRRSERTIKNWLDGKEKIPWWVPEVMRLQNMEHWDRLRHMNAQPWRYIDERQTAAVYDFSGPPQLSIVQPDTQTMPLFAVA